MATRNEIEVEMACLESVCDSIKAKHTSPKTATEEELALYLKTRVTYYFLERTLQLMEEGECND